MKQNILRWLNELLLIVVGLMVLDDGLFAIVISAVFGILESSLLILTCKRFVAWTFLIQYFRRPWIPLILFLICFGIYCCLKRV
jgi:hypothetical protein